MADSQLIYNCPGCGKPTPATLGAWTNKCQYCGLVVRVSTPGSVLKYFYPPKIDQYGARMAADRFLKENQLPLTGNISKAEFYYLPFYRYRAMALDYLSTTEMPEPNPEDNENLEPLLTPVKKHVLKGKDFDVTIPASNLTDFNMPSLGIRPAAIPLYGYCPADIASAAIIVGSDTTPQQIENQAVELHSTNLELYSKGKPLCSAMIGEQISMIYFPIWALTHNGGGQEKTVFVDALAKRGYYQTQNFFAFAGKNSNSQNSQYIKPQRHQCPNCGADLPELPFSLFYPCRNCNRAYILVKDGYKQILPQVANAPACAPYWRFPLELSDDKSYKTVSDFSRLLVSEVALLRKEKKDRRFYLYSPAFKSLDAARWAELALGVIKTQPHDELTETMPTEGPEFCVEEPEAKQMAIFLWKIATARYVRLQNPKFRIDETNLPQGEAVWLPIADGNILTKSKSFKQVNVVNK